MKLRPLSNKVVLKKVEKEQTTKSGLILSANVSEDMPCYDVVAVGPGKKDEPMEVKVGDVVIYGKYAGTEVSVEGKDYLIMKQSDILAIL